MDLRLRAGGSVTLQRMGGFRCGKTAHLKFSHFGRIIIFLHEVNYNRAAQLVSGLMYHRAANDDHLIK